MSEKKSYGWAYPIILIGGLAIGAYFIWQWLQKTPLAQATNTITNTIEKITESQYVIDKTTQGISNLLTNPATGQTPSIMPPSIFTPLNPVMSTKTATDLLTAGAQFMVGTGIKTSANIIGATSSPSGMEATKNVLLDFITGGFLKSGAGLVSPPIEKKTIISSPQGTYVATSPIVGINWQTTSVLSQPVKDVLTALQTKVLTQQGFVTQPVGTRIVATNAEVKPITYVDVNVDTNQATITKGTTIVPKTTVSAPLTALPPIVPKPIAPTSYVTTIRGVQTPQGLTTTTMIKTSVVSQPSYIKPTLVSGSGAYAKPGGM